MYEQPIKELIPIIEKFNNNIGFMNSLSKEVIDRISSPTESLKWFLDALYRSKYPRQLDADDENTKTIHKQSLTKYTNKKISLLPKEIMALILELGELGTSEDSSLHDLIERVIKQINHGNLKEEKSIIIIGFMSLSSMGATKKIKFIKSFINDSNPNVCIEAARACYRLALFDVAQKFGNLMIEKRKKLK